MNIEQRERGRDTTNALGILRRAERRGIEVNKSKFMDYITDNFNISGEAFRLIDNILTYAERLERDKQYDFLREMLDGTIGLTDTEIRSVL